MKNPMKVMHDTKTIEMSRKFAKLAENPLNAEAVQFMTVCNNFPSYRITVAEKRKPTGRELCAPCQVDN